MVPFALAFGMAHPWALGHPNRRTPLAVGPAVPDADSYGVSVPLRRAPGRESRVPSAVDVPDDCGAWFVSFASFETTGLLGVL